MFLQTRFDRHFDYTGDIPIPVCFHNRKPSYYVHTKQCIQEFDLFTGGLLASIPSGVPSDRNVAQMCASFSKKGQEYVVACQDNANMTVYDMTRRHFVATTTDGYASSTMTVFAATHGGIDPSAFGCGYNDHAISGICLTGMMSSIECDRGKLVDDVFITAAACSYRGCTLAIGTSDNLVLLYQIGKRGFGDVSEDDQEEEDQPEATLEKIIDMGRGLEATEDRLKGYNVEMNNIVCISWHPQMKVFACGRSDGSIVLYSCPLGAWFAKLDACEFGDNIVSLCFHPTEPLLFVVVTGEKNPPLLLIYTYAPRKKLILCAKYKVSELAEDLPAYSVPSLSCHPRENVIMLSFPNGRVIGLSLWDKYTHLARGMTNASPRQVPFRAFYQGTTEEIMKPLTMPLVHFFTNYDLELKKNKPTPSFLVNFRGMREQWSHYLVELKAAIHGVDNEAVVVRADGLKLSEDGQSVVVFLRPEASEKPRERQLIVDPSLGFDVNDEENYAELPTQRDDPRRYYIFLPCEKATKLIKEWEERDPEEEVTEEMEKAYFQSVLFDPMPKEEPCRDVLPLNNGYYLVIAEDGSQLQFRHCQAKNLKTPGQEKGEDPVEILSQTERVWKLNQKAKRMFGTPLKTAEGQEVVQFVVEDAAGTEWLVFSKNYADGKQGYTPMPRSKGLHFHAGEVVCEVAWQQLEEGEKPLCAIRTNQRILMVDLDYHVIAERPSVVLIGGTARLTTSMQWLGYTIMYSCSDNRLYYMMADSRERPIGALDVHASEPILMSVLPDRVLYACKHRDHRLTQLLSRALVPLEPLVMGLLYAPDGYVKNREELMLKIIRQYAYKPAEEDPNGPRPIGPGYNAGVTGELIREFRKKGYMSVAYAIVRSSGGNKEFPDHPQIAPEVKSDLAMSLHRLDDALQELLSDVPQLMEYLKSAEEGKPFTAQLPHPRSTLAERLRALASIAAICGDFNTARKCMDLCGDDWDLMTLMNLGGETTSSLLQQQAQRADGLRPDIKQAAEILSGKTQKSKKRNNEAMTAMNLPQRIPTLLVGGEQASLPTWKLKRLPRIPEIPKPEPLPSQYPLLEMSNIAAWVGARQIVEVREEEGEGEEDPRFGGAALMVGNEGEDSCVLYLRMEEREDGQANLVYDDSNQANNMTINGAAFIEPTDLNIDKGDGDKVKILRQLVLGWDKDGKEAPGTLTSKITMERNTLRVAYFHPDPQRRYFTVEMWVKRDGRNGYMPLITRGTESDRMWSFGLENGYVVFETTVGKMFTDASLVPADTWKHIAAVVDCSNKKMTSVKLFVDGKEVKEGKITSPEREPLEENDQIMIGGTGTFARITEVRYWASERSEDDIRDFSKAYLDLAESKKMKGLVIHDRNCTCESCQRRRERQQKANRRNQRAEEEARAAEEAKKAEEEAARKAAEEAAKQDESISLKMEVEADEPEEAEEEEVIVKQVLKPVMRRPLKRRSHQVEDEAEVKAREERAAKRRAEREAKEKERMAREEERRKKAEEEEAKRKAEEEAARKAVEVAVEVKAEEKEEVKAEEPKVEEKPVEEAKVEEKVEEKPAEESKPEEDFDFDEEPKVEKKEEAKVEEKAEEKPAEEPKAEEKPTEEAKAEEEGFSEEEKPKTEEKEKKTRRGRRNKKEKEEEKEEKKEEKKKGKKGKKEKKEKKEEKKEAIDDEDFDFDEEAEKPAEKKEEEKKEEPKVEKKEAIGDEDFDFDEEEKPAEKKEEVKAEEKPVEKKEVKVEEEDFDFDEEPKAEEKKVEEKPEEKPTEEPKAEEPKVEEKPEEKKVEEPKPVEESKVEEKPAEEPKPTEEPKPEEKPEEEGFSEEEKTEEPKAEEKEKKTRRGRRNKKEKEEEKKEEKKKGKKGKKEKKEKKEEKPAEEKKEAIDDEDFDFDEEAEKPAEKKEEEKKVEEKPVEKKEEAKAEEEDFDFDEEEKPAEKKAEEPKPAEEKKEVKAEEEDFDFDEEEKPVEKKVEEPKAEEKKVEEEEFSEEEKPVEKKEEPKVEEEEFSEEEKPVEKPKVEEKPAEEPKKERRGKKPLREVKPVEKEVISEGEFSEEEKPEEKKPEEKEPEKEEEFSEEEKKPEEKKPEEKEPEKEEEFSEEEKPKARTPIPEKESAEESGQEALPVARERSQKAPEAEKPARSHHKKGEHRHHHHHHSRKSARPAPEREENVLGDFVKEEKEAISASSDSEGTAQPTYTFTSPITRLSRSPTPMVHRSLVIAPGRRFVPQKTVEAISSSSDDEDPTFLGRSSIIPSRSFAPSASAAGSRTSMPGSAMGRQSRAFGTSFGANRSSVFSRNSMAPRSRNSTLINSDSDDDDVARRVSFASRPSMAPRTSSTARPSFGRFVKDDDTAKTMSKVDRYRSM